MSSYVTPRAPTTNSNPSNSFVFQYLMTADQVDTLMTELSDPTGFVDNIVKLFSDPMQAIVSLQCYPFDVKTTFNYTKEDGEIRIGNVAMKANGTWVSGATLPLLTVATFTISPINGSTATFLDYAPYTKHTLYLPYIGFVELDNDIVVGHEVKVKYAIDTLSGQCTAYLTATDTDEQEYTFLTRTGQCSVNIQIAGASGTEIARNLIKFGLGTASNIATLGTTAQALNLPAGVEVAAGLKMLGNTTINAIEAGKVNIHKGGDMGSALAFYGPQCCFLINEYTDTQYPTSYNSNIGRPSGKTKQLSTLTGYTVVDAVHVEGAGLASATQEELTEIERLLKSGVIL